MTSEDPGVEMIRRQLRKRKPHRHDVIVVGAGAAGVGVGVALTHAGIDDFLIVDRHDVGASFQRWPKEMKFITPSFPTNSIGMLDLNSVAIGTSPAYSLKVEHPSGPQFAHLSPEDRLAIREIVTETCPEAWPGAKDTTALKTDVP